MRALCHRVSCACLYLPMHSICDAAAPVSSADTWAPYHATTHSLVIHSTQLHSVAVVRLLDISDYYNAAVDAVRGTGGGEAKENQMQYRKSGRGTDQDMQLVQLSRSMQDRRECRDGVTEHRVYIQACGRTYIAQPQRVQPSVAWTQQVLAEPQSELARWQVQLACYSPLKCAHSVVRMDLNCEFWERLGNVDHHSR